VVDVLVHAELSLLDRFLALLGFLTLNVGGVNLGLIGDGDTFLVKTDASSW